MRRIIAASAFAIGLSALASGAAPCTSPYSVSTMNVGPQRDIIANDFDGDKKVDLVLFSYASGKDGELTFLKGNGDGTFTISPERVPQIGQGTGTGAAVDLNGDGLDDIVEPNSASGTTTLILNKGNGRFQVSAYLSPGVYNPIMQVGGLYNPYSVVAADVNGDKVKDVLISDYGVFQAWINRGNGVIKGLAPNAMLWGLRDMTVGDIDGDGNLDVVVGTASQGAVVFRRGRGDGTFNTTEFATARSHPVSPALADVDGDGDLDLITANTDSTVSVLLNEIKRPVPFIESASFATVPSYGAAVQLIAWDFPGKSGQIAVLNSEYGLETFNRSADGTFIAGRSIRLPRAGGRMVAADFDGDGDRDFAVVSTGWSTAAIIVDPCSAVPTRRRAVGR